MRGRHRIPTQIHLLKGTYRQDRHGVDFQPPPSRPNPPAYFTGERLELWNRFVKQQEDVGLLTEIDAGALTRLVNWTIKSNEAHGLLADKGLMANFQKSKDGWVQFSAILLLSKMADEMVAKAESELGRTPLARTHIKAELPPKDDPFEAYKRKKKA